MTLDEIVSMFRNETGDVEQPYLWGTEEVSTYVTDAYNMLVRFLGGAPDSTSAATSVTVTNGSTAVTLSTKILRVTRAFRLSDGKEVGVIDSTDVPLVRGNDGKLMLLRAGVKTGPVEFLIIGTGAGEASVFPTPAAGDALKLQIRRLPLTALSAGTDVPVDLREEHHLHLIKWMKALAYRKQDVETFNMDRAMENEASFLAYCEQAAYEQERLMRKGRVGPRTRSDIRAPQALADAYRTAAKGRAPAPRQQGAEG